MTELIYPDSATPQDLAAFENATPEQQDIASGLAWSTLQVLMANQLSIAPRTVRPCAKRCIPGTYLEAPVYGPGSSFTWPMLQPDGTWINVLTCSCIDDCSCTRIRKINLTGPVGAIESVTIDGVDVDPSVYRVDNGNELIRMDGEDWPTCQDMNLAAGEVGTFTVTYYQGAAPDTLDNYAAGILIDEYIKALTGGKGCRLPKGTTNVVRQGVTFEVNQSWFLDGSTGIPEVDLVIQRRNPYHVRSGATVFSPDDMPARYTSAYHEGC